MPLTGYSLGNSLRILQPFKASAPSPASSTFNVIKSPAGFMLRLVAFGLTYTFNQAAEVARDIALQIVDESGNVVVADDGSAALTVVGTSPGPPAQVGWGVGGLGTEAGAIGPNGEQIFTFGTIDMFIPSGFTYQLLQIGFDAGDTASEGSGIIELIVNEDASGGSGLPSGAAQALAFLLHTP